MCPVSVRLQPVIKTGLVHVSGPSGSVLVYVPAVTRDAVGPERELVGELAYFLRCESLPRYFNATQRFRTGTLGTSFTPFGLWSRGKCKKKIKIKGSSRLHHLEAVMGYSRSFF